MAGVIRYEGEQTYQALTPSVLTAYKGLSCLPGDVLAQSSGSAIGGSTSVNECVDSNQGAICIWDYNYNYGNAGQLRYLYDCYVDANNRLSLYIGADNNLTLSISGNGTTRTVSTSFASIKPFAWTHIIAAWSKNTTVNGSNYLYVYLNGAGAGSTSVPVAMTSVPSTFSIGSDYTGKNSANGLLAYKIMRQYMTSDQVTTDYNSGNGSTEFFTRTPHTIALGLTSDSNTGISYVHSGQAISTISTVTLTLAADIGGRSWTNGDQVVVWDDANPPNVVRTTINGTPSGSTIVVADSCAAVTGTNKFISKNLIVDPMMGLSHIGAWTAGADTTVTKNTTTPINGTSDLKLLNTSTTQGKATQAVTTIANADYYLYGLVKPQITPLASARIIDVDGTAALSQTVGQAKLMGKNVNCAGSYFANGGDIHDIGTNDLSLSIWIKTSQIVGTGMIISKRDTLVATNAGFNIYKSNTVITAGLFDGVGVGGGRLVIGTQNIVDGKWHHIAATYDRDGNLILYIDGVVNGSGSLTGYQLTCNNEYNFYVGCGTYNGNTGFAFNGKLCDAKIAIGTVWTPEQVLYQYNNPFDIGASAGTITEAYACTEGTGTTLTASVTPATNNLTLSNALAWNLGEVQEAEWCFQSTDTETTVDLTVPCAVSGELAYWDNVKVMASLVANGGCEGGADPPTGWTQEANATVISDTSPHAGTNCLKVTAGADNVGAYQNVTLVTGKHYTIIAYCKATAGDTARVIVDTGDGTLLTVGSVTATTWTRVRISFTATGTSGKVRLVAVANTDVVWFDDIAILRDDSAVATTATKSGIVPTNQPLIIR